MANEISYPFNTDSPGGGSQMMSHGQWQVMAKLFGKDRVDYRLTANSIDSTTLPFYAAVVSGTSVSIAPGRALVGGFYYQNTATQTVTIAANTGALPRTDLIVLRADLTSAGQVNLKVVQGQPAASPQWPGLTKAPGYLWEMPLHVVNVPANSGALSLINVMPYDMPEHVAAPWNVNEAGSFQQVGTFVYDMDNNTNSSQMEYFKGRDGFVTTRHLGKSTTYTPNLFNGKTALGAENRTGRWRYVAPNVVHVSMNFTAYEDQGVVVSGSNWYLGATLPKPANGQIRQVLTGFLSNPDVQGGLPNAAQVIAQTQANSPNLTLYIPNPNNLAQGLDGFRTLPPRSTLNISGTYEANEFGA